MTRQDDRKQDCTNIDRKPDWTNLDRDPEQATRYLDLLGKILRGAKRRTFDLMDLRPGSRVLEVGCGVGRDAEAMAARVTPGGSVIGIDISAELVGQANARVAGSGLKVTFRVADAHMLPFADAEFDGARIDRVLQNLAEPARAVGELRRIVRQGGRVVAIEPERCAAFRCCPRTCAPGALATDRVPGAQGSHVCAEVR